MYPPLYKNTVTTQVQSSGVHGSRLKSIERFEDIEASLLVQSCRLHQTVNSWFNQND